MSAVSELLNLAAEELQAAGCPSAENDVQLLLAHVLKIERTQLPKIEMISSEQESVFRKLVKDRSKRIPLQHLTGEGFFRYLTLHVGNGVFIPRPETELLVQAGLDYLSRIEKPKLVVDLCAGSGAIALSVALESPNTTVHAIELSEKAFNFLEQNISSYAQQLTRLNSSIITYNDDATNRKLLENFNGQVDLALSNPPYIPDGMIPREPEVRDFEPKLALYGGATGLEVATKITWVAADLLKPNGLFGIEHADVQGDTALKMVSEMQNDDRSIWSDVNVNQDYNQLPRYVTAKRTSFSSLGVR